jgi:hypothetical protein
VSEKRVDVSRDVVDSGKQVSINGFLNTEEFMKALSKGVGWTSFASLGIAVVIALGESVHLWYTGPLAPTVIAVAGVLVGYLRTKRIGARLIEDGDDAPR